MNLLNKKFIKFKNKGIKIEYIKNKLIITNNSDTHGFFVYPSIFRSKDKKYATMKFYGEIIKGNGAVLQILDLNRNILSENPFNATTQCNIEGKKVIYAIKIHKKSKVIIDEANIVINNEPYNEFEEIINSKNDILIITPSYPSEENKYFGGFVHTRVQAYKKSGLKFDLICAHNYNDTCNYTFEGINVARTNFNGLRNILTKKRYKKILVHFFDYNYSKVFDACELSNTLLYFWIHGPETLYWDWPNMTDQYFQPETPLNSIQIEQFRENDKLIKRYNDYDNVHWIFVSEWIKKRSEELINIKFKNYSVIPNYIDENVFTYKEKEEDLRKNIFFIRRFENINKYAIDINVRTILELSRRDFFDDLEFNIYGTGENYDMLIAPIKDFKNVHLYPQFMTHTDISKIHKQNGIGLFATRYDAQGVSMCEAAMSGLAIISSENEAIQEFIPNEVGNLCNTEDYKKYADEIERLYKNPEQFVELSKKCHEKIYNKCNFKETIKKEIDLIKEAKGNSKELLYNPEGNNKILTIIIPSYNIAQYLYHGVYTILEHKNGNKIELIIVNDASKDNTLSVAKKLQERYSSSIIKIIDKENGGHGSTINEGLKIATGKYIRIIDGDDWVNTKDMEKLIDVLEKEEADIVLTDYCEDRAESNQLIPKTIYQFMIPGKIYRFDDLCYEGYGFQEWGPILATANFKKELLQNTFTLTEKSSYIDMEFDAYSISNADTIVYYPLDIYRYFIGREGQSISKESYERNFKQHENILFKLIEFYKNSDITQNKKTYILNKLIIPMLIAHYTILVEFLKSRKEFNLFDSKLKKYPNLYNDCRIATKMKKIHRKTKGIFIKYNSVIRKFAQKLLRV